MAFLRVDFYSEALGSGTGMNVLLPEAAQGIGFDASAGTGALPVLYLLHGLSDDHTAWMRRTSLERYAASRRLAVVMPCGGRSFYTNEAHGGRYWDFISEELPRAVQSFFPVSRRREDTFAAGLSMGGYGALKLALRHPDRYAAAASFSGVVDVAQAASSPAFRGIFPDGLFDTVFGAPAQVRGTENDLFALLDAQPAVRPRLYVSCGTADPFFPSHRRFVSAARAAGWDLTDVQEPNAAHNWDFWDAQIRAALDWLFQPGAARA